jgi:hypothetical protein
MNLIPSIKPKYKGEDIHTLMVGDNADQLPIILDLYAMPGQTIYDVTWGKGAMWKKIDLRKYRVHGSDNDPSKIVCPPPDGIQSLSLQDFTRLAWGSDNSGDVLILDPPYMGGKKTHKDLAEASNNQNDDHAAVLRLYMGGILEAYRVLKYGGRIFVKCQDEMSGGQQRWSHSEIIDILGFTGFEVIDLFILGNERRPMMAHDFQRSARKNHSYWVIAQKPCPRPTRRSGSSKSSPKLNL